MALTGNRPLAAAAAALAAAGASALTAPALTAPALADSGARTYQAVLDPLNHQKGSGTLTLELDGRTATVTEHYSGLAGLLDGEPYPHLQHVHGGAEGRCPAPGADADGDGVVSTAEGEPFYGPVRTTLSVRGETTPAAGTDLEIAPHGAALDYERVIELDDATLASLRDGTAVVVVQGLDPSLIGEKARSAGSDLVPGVPLSVTAPALCGALRPMAAHGADTGAGTTGGTRVLGAGLIALAGAALALAARRRTA